MADVHTISGESADVTAGGAKRPSKVKFQRKPKGGSKNTVAPPIPAEAGASKPGKTVRPTAFTKPRNEPMFDDLDIAGFNGITPYHGRNRLAITAEGFIPLVEKEYNIISTKEPQFATTISKSMFVYYCIQHLYARLIYIKKSDQGELPLVEDQFLEFINSGNYTILDPVKSYINGIGVVTDTSGVEYKIDFPAWPNSQGDFGRVGTETHYMYESLPAPAVITQRIKQDLLYTITPNTPINWQLPDRLVPAEQAAGLPTKNLLGWAASVTLTSDQRACLERLDITADNFPSRYGGFKLNTDLLITVSGAIESMTKIKTSKTDMTTNYGSQAIISFTDVEPGDYDFVRNAQYAELGNVRQLASQQLDARASLAGLLMTYRCRKNAFNDHNYWCAYDFGEYANVPAGWIATSNSVFTHGRAERLNLVEFSTKFTSKDIYREPWLTGQCKV